MNEPIQLVTPAPYVTIPIASAMTGLTPKAIRRKIEEGKWLEGREYKKDSESGDALISISGFTQWVESGQNRGQPASRKRPVTAVETHLYRHFDEDGNLLYVGISLSSFARLSAHKRTARWARLIKSMTIERFKSRADALAAELNAIRNEKPIYNIIGNVSSQQEH